MRLSEDRRARKQSPSHLSHLENDTSLSRHGNQFTITLLIPKISPTENRKFYFPSAHQGVFDFQTGETAEVPVHRPQFPDTV